MSNLKIIHSIVADTFHPKTTNVNLRESHSIDENSGAKTKRLHLSIYCIPSEARSLFVI